MTSALEGLSPTNGGQTSNQDIDEKAYMSPKDDEVIYGETTRKNKMTH